MGDKLLSVATAYTLARVLSPEVYIETILGNQLKWRPWFAESPPSSTVGNILTWPIKDARMQS